MLYNALDHEIIDQTRTAMLGEMIEKHVDKYFEAGNAIKAFGSNLVPSDKLLGLIASSGPNETMTAPADRPGIREFRSLSVETGAKKQGAMAADDSIGQWAQAGTSSERWSGESCKRCKSRQTCHRTCSGTDRAVKTSHAIWTQQCQWDTPTTALRASEIVAESS